MSQTQLTPETAPRDAAELAKIGRFNLRMLAEKLGLFSDEATKAAFMSLSNEEQADNCAKALAALDGAKAPAGKAGGGTPPRTPQTSKTGPGKAAAAAGGSKVGGTATGSGGGGSVGGGENIGKLMAKFEELLTAVNGASSKLDEIGARVGDLENAMGSLQGTVAGNNKLAVVAIGASLKLAEEVLQAGPEAVLGAVIQDLGIVENTIAAVLTVEDSADDEGNEQ